jgi:hypothetical protein
MRRRDSLPFKVLLPKATAGDEPQPYEKSNPEGLVPLSNFLNSYELVQYLKIMFQCPEGLVPLSNWDRKLWLGMAWKAYVSMPRRAGTSF